MILSIEDLTKAWRAKEIRFEPDITIEQITLSSIDLHFGYEVARFKPHADLILKPGTEGFDPRDITETIDLRKQSQTEPLLIIKPKELWLAFTYEKLYVPYNLAANVQGRSTLARTGLAVHITAPHIHPGFRGKLTLELYNHGDIDIALRPAKDLVCQIIYYKMTKRVTSKHVERLGTYLDQETPLPKRKARRMQK
jgi:dCTP deaminase